MSTFQMPFFYFIKTVSKAEINAWLAQAKDKAEEYFYQGNRISAEFEPIKGWRPFAKYGTNPVEIIHNCIQDYDNTVNKILFCRDRFAYKTDTFHLHGKIAGFNFYNTQNPRNALILPLVIGKETSVYNIMNNPTNYPESDLVYSYQDYYNKFPPEVKQYILNMNLPYVKAAGGLDSMQAHVFPPAICEISHYDSLYNSTITSAFEHIKWTIVKWAREKKADSFWLRESCTGMGQFVWQVNKGLTRNRIDSNQALFPCFCIG
nr:MAG TPA: hypothetical protein [Caudoviricetes sp.]